MNNPVEIEVLCNPESEFYAEHLTESCNGDENVGYLTEKELHAIDQHIMSNFLAEEHPDKTLNEIFELLKIPGEISLCTFAESCNIEDLIEQMETERYNMIQVVKNIIQKRIK